MRFPHCSGPPEGNLKGFCRFRQFSGSPLIVEVRPRGKGLAGREEGVAVIAYSSVFKRVEKKYRIGTAERAAIEVAVEGAMAVDA